MAGRIGKDPELNALMKKIEELNELLDRAKSEIRYSESSVYNFDFTAGCEYAIAVIERHFGGLNNG